jgi:hypothetical protein
LPELHILYNVNVGINNEANFFIFWKLFLLWCFWLRLDFRNSWFKIRYLSLIDYNLYKLLRGLRINWFPIFPLWKLVSLIELDNTTWLFSFFFFIRLKIWLPQNLLMEGLAFIWKIRNTISILLTILEIILEFFNFRLCLSDFIFLFSRFIEYFHLVIINWLK